jgi:hypothetical protein
MEWPACPPEITASVAVAPVTHAREEMRRDRFMIFLQRLFVLKTTA